MSRHARSAQVADGRGLSRGVSEVSQSPSCSSVIKPLFRASLMAASVAAAIGVATPAMAFEFSLADGEVKGSFDTTLSYGILMRADKRDPTLVGGLASGRGLAASVNGDDGNQTYDRGDVVSSLFKMNNDLSLSYRNYGFFARTLAFYDTAIDSKETFNAGPGLSPEAKKRLRDDARILDFYVRGSFDVAGKNLNARLGRQVINWGESTFIPNGINVINPVDVARLRAPGSELKEGLLPQEMLWVSQELTQNLTAEAFYQFQWRETRIDPRGSFFSSNDLVSPGSTAVYTGFGVTTESQTNPLAVIPRTGNRDPRDSGQFGVAARILAPTLNNTEFGVFFLQYHSRTPLVSTTRGTNAAASSATFFSEFPEEINLYGLSASGSGPAGTSLQAEYSYRPNQPLQMASIELLLGALGRPNANNLSANPGERIQGWREVKMHQFQTTASKSFGPVLGSSQLTGVAEVGVTYLDLPDNLLFDGPGVGLPFNKPATSGAAINPNSIGANGYMTKRSWGYRLLSRADYPNAIGSWTLSPRVAFAHDVRGVGPTFNQGVQSVSFGVTANLRNQWTADLSYTGFMGGRTYSGVFRPTGAAMPEFATSSSANALKDRDFIAATVSYSF